jgi:hypothetical protein
MKGSTVDQNRFGALMRSLTGAASRRDVARGLTAAGLGLGSMRLPDLVEAKKKRKNKKKRKKARPNAFGCLEVGDPCKTEEQCCSGICEGKKSKRKCRAHDAGSCLTGAQIDVCGGPAVACTSSFGQPGQCATTTGNAAYCLAAIYCHACTTDVECQEANGGLLGPNAACFHCAGDVCPEAGGTACAGPFDLL